MECSQIAPMVMDGPLRDLGPVSAHFYTPRKQEIIDDCLKFPYQSNLKFVKNAWDHASFTFIPERLNNFNSQWDLTN